MAKKKKGKVIQILSPENYIRQKARNLPIHECRINRNWQKHGLANITVARKHSNGNITLGRFLVDLKCLGVKDAHYLFNVSEHEYKKIAGETYDEMNSEPVSYTLAHNIIYAGIEFADDYRFKPHKDFTSVAQYILEEDTDDIELIDIECGEDGKPFYMRGPLDTEKRANQIIAQLEREAGPGNYEVVWQTEEDFDEDGVGHNTSWLEDDVDEIEEKYEGLSTGEKVDLIIDMLLRIKKLSAEENEELVYLTNTVINSYLDFDLLNTISKELTEKLLEYDITGEFSDEMLGIGPDSKISREKWEKQFSELYYLATNKPKSAGKKIKKLQKEMPENPALAFLELIVLQSVNSPDYAKKSDTSYQQFPDYPLIKIFRKTQEWLKNTEANPVDLFKSGPELFFSGKETLHNFEVFHYLLLLIITAGAFGNISLLEAVDMISDELEMSEENYEILSEMITVSKMNFILSLKEEAEANFRKGNNGR
jgi:hypothetical protein